MNVLDKWNPFRFDRSQTKPTKNPVAKHTETPRHPLALLEEEMNRMVERLWKEPLPGFTDLQPWFGDFRQATFHPKLDVTDEGDFIEVTAELPGMVKDDVTLTFEDGMLLLSGEKKHTEEKREKGCYRLERSYGKFQRTVPLPADVDVEKAEATFDKGVLKVHFKKLPGQEPETKKIPIKG